MDTSTYQGGTGGGESTMESVDWRTQMASDSQKKIVIKIMDTLKKHHPSWALEKPQEIKSIAQRLEEKIYTTTTSQSDYVRKISMKLLTMESRSANLVPNSLQCNFASSSVNPSDPGSHGIHQVNNQGQQPLPIPVPSNHPQATQQILSQSIHSNIPSSGVQVSAGVSSALPPVNALSQPTISNISSQNPNLQNIQNFVNQRQIPTRQQQQQQSQNSQQYLYRHQIHQIAKHNLHIQQQHQNLLQPSHFQPSSLSTAQQNQQPVIQHHQQSALRQQRQQPLASIVHQQPPPPQSNPMGQQTSATNLQQQQPRLLSQQNNPSNVQQPHQHSIGQHKNFPAIHQQQTMLNNQHSTQVMQSKVSIPQKNHSMQGQRSQLELQVMPQLQTQSGQLQHQLNMKLQSNMSQRDMQQRLPTSGAFQQQNVIDQQQKQLFQQQRAMPEASSTSSDSTAQIGNQNNGDWQEEVYQKIKAMKDKYMPGLTDLYPKIMIKLHLHDSLPQQPKNEQFEKAKMLKHIFDSCLNFLQVPRSNILPIYKEKLDLYEKQIINIILTFNRKPGPHLQQPLPSPTQVHPHESHMNSPNSTMFQLKQLQPHHQMKHHFLQKQQQQQFNRQTKQQQLQLPHIGVKIESLTRPGPPFSPQISSPNVDQQNPLTSVTKSATCTPLQSANSPFTMSSPSTPSTSHILGDSEKVNLGIPNAGNVGHQSNVASHSLSLPFGTPGISASPLLAEFTSPDGNHGNEALIVYGKSSSTIEKLIEHLLKVVKSISAKSLSASVSDIGSVVSMIDSIAGSGACIKSRAAIGEDLVATTKCRLQSTTTGKRKTKMKPLNVVSSASNVNDSFKRFSYLEASELESTATSSIKRPRIKTSNALLEEIRGINWGLIDTMVDISEEDAGSGIVVKFSFGAVNIKSQYASAKVLPIQPLRLLVPANYPSCSPILLDKFPVEISKEEELEDLSMKAKWRFHSCVRMLSEPMSLEEMARTWDTCARVVISEYAHQTSGGAGGTFTSKYGPWEDCLTFIASA
ncbi:hypothetical protein Lser_V15G28019 [Lactuca serriola]